MKPITPNEAKQHIIDNFPTFVVEAVNNCINKNYFNRDSFSIKQRDIIAEIIRLSPETISEGKITENHWLDFEPLYGKFGWEVKYHSPGWDENYDAYFTFKVKK